MLKGQTFKRSSGAAGGQVVEHVRRLLEAGQLKPGDRLPPERDLATQMGVSRPSVRSGLRSLQTMGIVRSRQGSGTYIVDGPARLGGDPLRFLAALHGFTREEMFEARRVLEVGTVGLSAERATPEQIAVMADEVTGMFASLEEPQMFLVHDVQFHRSLAAGSQNQVLITLIETLSEMFYEGRRLTIEHAVDLRESAEMHRGIYTAVRSRNVDEARRQMDDHLLQAQKAQAVEPESVELKARKTLVQRVSRVSRG
jgi:GntR family transcriptional regulator, transcriptional repressor for pyruvate dehydrogenase complex